MRQHMIQRRRRAKYHVVVLALCADYAASAAGDDLFGHEAAVSGRFAGSSPSAEWRRLDGPRLSVPVTLPSGGGLGLAGWLR